MNTFLLVGCPNWGLGSAPGSGPYGVCPSLTTSNQNKGNLQGVTAYAPPNSANSTPTPFTGLIGIPQTFTYDGLNRIQKFTDNSSSSSPLTRTFGYDACGKMWISANNGLAMNVVTPPPTAQSAFNANNNQLTNGNYDAAGNQQTVGLYSLTYDAENRQVSESNTASKPPATYLYDGDGRRVEKQLTGGGAQTLYIYDAAGGLAAEYTTGTNLSGCQTCYLSYDHLGSTRMVTDEAHNVIERHDYMPFGDELPSGYSSRGSLWGTTSGIVNQKFTGKERDGESGLDYFGARYYGSALGRFTSPDWAPGRPSAVPFANWSDPQSLNLYAYVRNNPLSSEDEDGHDPGDRFKTKVEAAADAVKYMRAQPGGYKVEYGSRIHNDSGSFTHGPVVTQNDPGHVQLPDVQKNDVGDVHTHDYGVKDPDTGQLQDKYANTIQDPDKMQTVDAGNAVKLLQDDPRSPVDYQSYVGAPNGELIQFTPTPKVPGQVGESKVVQKGVARDPHPPSPPPPDCKKAGACK